MTQRLKPTKSGSSLTEVLVAITVLGAGTALLGSAWSTSAHLSQRNVVARTAHSITSEQSELIRRKVEAGDASPWSGTSGPFHQLRTPTYRTWELRLNGNRRRYDLRIGTALTCGDLAENSRIGRIPQPSPVPITRDSEWYLLNATNMGSADETLALRKERLSRIQGLGLDLLVHVAALRITEAAGRESPAPPGGAVGPEPREVLLWQVDALCDGARMISTQFVTWAPVHVRSGEPR